MRVYPPYLGTRLRPASEVDKSGFPLIVCGDAHSRAERVADSTHRHDPLRIARIELDLPAQVRNVDVTRTLVADVRALPEMLHDLPAAEDSLRLLGKEQQQPELRARQL